MAAHASMRGCIPIPDPARLAAMLALLLAAAAAPATAAYTRALAGTLLPHRTAQIAADGLSNYAALLMTLALVGIGTFGLPLLWSGWIDDHGAPYATALALVAAPLIGRTAFAMDLALGRRRRRRAIPVAAPAQRRARIARHSPWQALPPQQAAMPRAGTTEPGLTDIAGADRRLLVGIGILEEIAVRALPIIVIATLWPNIPNVLTAACIGIWFAALHARFEPSEFFRKLPLSAGATALLLTGGPIPAALAHALFNRAVAERHRTAAIV
ncbi:hypothetical protein ACX40Y_13930 [Sphingomonas sp. RS6]